MKADDKYTYKNKKGKEMKTEFSNFDLLKKEVEVQRELISDLTEILIENQIYRKSLPPTYDSAEVFRRALATSSEESIEEDDEEDDDEEEEEEDEDEDLDEDDEEEEDPENPIPIPMKKK